ncbi:unnamed protein product [Merluccius merluccius]
MGTDVIHTVGPVARGRAGPSESSDLSSCYQNSLKLLVENNLTTVPMRAACPVLSVALDDHSPPAKTPAPQPRV